MQSGAIGWVVLLPNVGVDDSPALHNVVELADSSVLYVVYFE